MVAVERYIELQELVTRVRIIVCRLYFRFFPIFLLKIKLFQFIDIQKLCNLRLLLIYVL